MTTSRETLLGQFADAWVAGERPRVDRFLARASAAERDALEDELLAFVQLAPAPRHPEEVRAEIRSEPVTRAISDMADAPNSWATLLPALRRRARLRRDELARRLSEALGVSGAEAKVGRYYHGLEAGILDPSGVSSRVVSALAALLRVPAAELDEAGAPGGTGTRGPAVAFSRAYELAPETLEASAARPPERPQRDEVDLLFLGGR